MAMRNSIILALVICSGNWLVADDSEKPVGATTDTGAKSAPPDASIEQPDVAEAVRQLIRDLDAGQKARRDHG